MTVLTGAFGSLADWVCDDCGFSLPEFPIEDEENEE